MRESLLWCHAASPSLARKTLHHFRFTSLGCQSDMITPDQLGNKEKGVMTEGEKHTNKEQTWSWNDGLQNKPCLPALNQKDPFCKQVLWHWHHKDQSFLLAAALQTDTAPRSLLPDTDELLTDTWKDFSPFRLELAQNKSKLFLQKCCLFP